MCIRDRFTNLILEKRTDDVVDEGRIFYRTDTQEVKVGTGTQAILAGARKLSQLEIDTDKNWGGYGISNLGFLDSKSFKLAGTEFVGTDGFLKSLYIARYYNEGELGYVTTTSERLIVSIFPDSPHKCFLTLQHMRVDLENPTGSGTAMHWRLAFELDDGTEYTVISGIVDEGKAPTYYFTEHEIIYPDGTRTLYFWEISSGRAIVAIKFYGYCDATPPIEYYPSIWARWITALQV